MGDYDACRHNHDELHYCTLSLDKLRMTQGLCLPTQCTATEITSFIAELNRTAEIKPWVDTCGKAHWNASCHDKFPSSASEQAVCNAVFLGLEPLVVKLLTSLKPIEETSPAIHCGRSYQEPLSSGAIVMLLICVALIVLVAAQLAREQLAASAAAARLQLADPEGLYDESESLFPKNGKSINGSVNEPPAFENLGACEWGLEWWLEI